MKKQIQNVSEARILRLWVTEGDKLFLKLKGVELSKKDLRVLRTQERQGFCHTYGIPSVYMTAMFVIPFVLNSVLKQGDLGAAYLKVCCILATFAAMLSVRVPIKKSSVKTRNNIKSHLKIRELKVYTATLLVGTGFGIGISERLAKHVVSHPTKPALVQRTTNSPKSIASHTALRM